MISLTKEEAFKRFMDYVHWQSDPHLVHDYFWNSGPTIDWLEDMGVVFAGAMRNFPASEQTWHVVQPDDGSRPGARAAGTMNKIKSVRRNVKKLSGLKMSIKKQRKLLRSMTANFKLSKMR